MNERLQFWYLEARRRLSRVLGNEGLIWPSVPSGLKLSPSQHDFAEYERAPLRLTWRKRVDGTSPLVWQQEARQRLRLLLGPVEDRCGDAVMVHEVPLKGLLGGLCGRRVYLRLENGRELPVSLVWGPHAADTANRVMLCLQGHTSGAHISWGRPRLPIDVQRIARGGDFARQAAGEGYVAVCIEQVCFGERRETAVVQRWEHPCIDAVNRALLAGRTLLGDRVGDVCAVLDWLSGEGVPGPPLDRTCIHAMGNSAGGETALFATALDERIGGVIAGSCVGSYRRTSGRRRACPDTVIPGILQWLEYEDVLALCAPRPALVVSGVHDHIYPYALAEECVAAAREVYAAMGAADRLRCVPGADGHRFYPDVAWSAFRELVGASVGPQ